MSFSYTVKEEILKNVKKVKGCCATSFLTAVVKSAGSLHYDFDGYGFSVESDNLDLLKFCANLAESSFGEEGTLVSYRSSHGKNNEKYLCKFGSALGVKLGLATVTDGALTIEKEMPDVTLSKPCCHRAFLQALFLSCGSVTIPEGVGDVLSESSHSNYHLELRFYSADFADFVAQQYPEIDFKRTTRKANTLLYLKDSAKIADFFVLVDAVNASFTVENVIIGRSFRNTANRQRNCIDSNIEKSVVAGVKHLDAIKKIREARLFESLPANLKEMALLREENPDANLSELAAICGISKSGVNHRLAKLVEIAQDL